MHCNPMRVGFRYLLRVASHSNICRKTNFLPTKQLKLAHFSAHHNYSQHRISCSPPIPQLVNCSWHKYPSSPRFIRSQHIRRASKMATSDPSVSASVNAAPIAPAETKTLSIIEASKRRAAYKAVEDHFDTSYSYIGIGSGSTVVYVVEAIAAKGRDITSKMVFVPTYGHLLLCRLSVLCVDECHVSNG